MRRFFAAGAAADKRMFDLPGFVLSRLRAAGVERCEWIGRDTYAEEALFFSNRRALHKAEGDYGRLLSAIALPIESCPDLIRARGRSGRPACLVLGSSPRMTR